MRSIFAGALGALALAHSAVAAPAPLPDVVVDAALVERMREMLANEVVAITLRAQNARHVGMNDAAKATADAIWRAETEAPDQPTITRIAANPLSIYLSDVAAGTYGLIAEIFVADAEGLNAGISAVTTDFDQSDEAKYQRTFQRGADAVFVDEPFYDEGRAMWRRQVNLTVVDPAEGRPIGIAVFEVNLHELARRRAVDGAGS